MKRQTRYALAFALLALLLLALGAMSLAVGSVSLRGAEGYAARIIDLRLRRIRQRGSGRGAVKEGGRSGKEKYHYDR